MARQLKLIKRADLAAVPGSDVDSLDLLPWLADKGWLQSSDGNEVITLHIPGVDDDDLAANVQAIDAKLREIEWAKDKLEPYGVWLRAQLTGETGARQAFILDGKRSPDHAVSGLFIKDSYLESYQLGLTRVPLWENTAEVDIPIEAAISANGGMLAYAELNGDAAARVASMLISMGNETGVDEYLKQFWIGAKGDRGGQINPFNFVPVWGLDNGSLNTNVTSVEDATALDGYKVVVSWATGSWALLPKVAIALSNIMASHFADQRGRYRALLRAKVTDPTLVARVRLGQAFVSSDFASIATSTVAYNPRQLIGSGSDWLYYDMGQVSLPPIRSPSGTPLDYAGFMIDAEKVSGTGDLELDSLILIPMDYSVHVAMDSYGVAGLVPMTLYSWPDGDLTGLVTYVGNDAPLQGVIPTQNNWALPQGNGAIVCAAQYATHSDIALTIWPTLRVYERWQTLRGYSIPPQAPVVTGLTPEFGPDSGGTEVTISGTGFVAGATSVTFGGVSGTGVVVNSSSSITVTSPTGSGTVDVLVTTPNGTSEVSGDAKFAYDLTFDFHANAEGWVYVPGGGSGQWSSGHLTIEGSGTWAYDGSGLGLTVAAGASFSLDLSIASGTVTLRVEYTDNSHDLAVFTEAGTVTLYTGAGNIGKVVQSFGVDGSSIASATFDNVVIHGFLD